MYEEKIMIVYYCTCNNKLIIRVDEKNIEPQGSNVKKNCVVVHDFEKTCGKSKKKYRKKEFFQ
jgi:hypothetical protein